jgi:hypothetical protein
MPKAYITVFYRSLPSDTFAEYGELALPPCGMAAAESSHAGCLRSSTRQARTNASPSLGLIL